MALRHRGPGQSPVQLGHPFLHRHVLDLRQWPVSPTWQHVRPQHGRPVQTGVDADGIAYRPVRGFLPRARFPGQQVLESVPAHDP